MEKLTKQEEEIMILIWELKECCVKDILKLLSPPIPPYTTVASIVKNLERKKYLSTKRFGNLYVYSPAIEEVEYKRSFMRNFVQHYFSNSYKEMVSFFAKEESISKEELKEIIRMIERKE